MSKLAKAAVNNYWAERQAKAQAALTEKSVKETQAQLRKYYRRSMRSVTDRFQKVYNKLQRGADGGIAPTPADLYKLDSYWQMQAQLRNELQKLGDRQMVLFSKRFEVQFMNIYNSIAIKNSTLFNKVDASAAKQMISQIWCADGKSWSERIWNNTDKLQQMLNDNLIDCVVTGKPVNQLRELLIERFNVSYRAAEAVAQTELAHIQTVAAQQRYKDYGIQYVQVWADYDERRCDKCGDLHEQKYPVGAAMPIPAHPRCRCCIVPVVD